MQPVLGEIFLSIALVLLVGVGAALVFTYWALASMGRFVLRQIKRHVGTNAAMPLSSPHAAWCPQPKCRAANPRHARFCRQCGSTLQASAVSPAIALPVKNSMRPRTLVTPR